MKGKNKRFIFRIFSENKILLLINFFVLCFICGRELKYFKNINMGVWGYIMIILTNHYYVLYCVLPILFIVIAKHIKGISQIEIIRYRNSFHQIRSTVNEYIQWLFVYFILHLLILFVIGIGTFGLNFQLKAIDLTGYNELILLLNKYIENFHSPYIAIISIILYYIFGFMVLLSLLSYVNYRFGYKKVIVVSVIVYVMTFIGFKTELKTILPVVCFNNFILLHHGLFVNGIAKFILVILFGLGVVMFCFGKKIKHSGFNSFIITRKEKIITLSIVLVLILLEIFRSFNIRDVMLTTMFGISENSISFIGWMRLTIMYMLPLFFIGIADSRVERYSQAPILIRFKNKASFEYAFSKEYIKYICLYTLSLFIIGNLTFHLGGSTNVGDYLFETFGIAFTNKILNIYLSIFFINLLFEFVIFEILNNFINAVGTVILMLLVKFIFFLAPQINYLNINFGIINLYDNVNSIGKLCFKTSILIVAILAYYIFLYVRRVKHVNN
jgi:hypothetical protein